MPFIGLFICCFSVLGCFAKTGKVYRKINSLNMICELQKTDYKKSFTFYSPFFCSI